MKHKTSLFRLSTLLLTALFFALPLKAQVMIGEQTDPQSFSLLELSTAVNKGGLRLPQLTTGERDLLTGVSSDANLSSGLMIYNTTIHCVEFWNSKKWVSFCDKSQGPSTVPATPGPITLSAATINLGVVK